jgi:hypothetical protein
MRTSNGKLRGSCCVDVSEKEGITMTSRSINRLRTLTRLPSELWLATLGVGLIASGLLMLSPVSAEAVVSEGLAGTEAVVGDTLGLTRWAGIDHGRRDFGIGR